MGLSFPSVSVWPLILVVFGLSGMTWGEKCDWLNCLSPQLNDAMRTEDKHNICRLLTPSLHCMQIKLPACRRLMGEENELYQVFETKLKKLHKEYSETCHAIYTSCTEFAKCLRPEIQVASKKQDIHSLCQIAPPVISCFETAIHKCQTRSRYENLNFELIESKLDKLRSQTAARCKSWLGRQNTYMPWFYEED